MEKSGTSRPTNSAAHHLVGDTSKRTAPARQILQGQRLVNEFYFKEGERPLFARRRLAFH